MKNISALLILFFSIVLTAQTSISENGLWTKEGWYKIGASGSDLFMTINSSGGLEWATELPNNDPSQVWAVVNHRTPASQGFMEIYATIPNLGTFTMSTTDELIEKDADGFPTRNITLTARPGVPKSVAYERTEIGVDEDGNPIYEFTYSGDLSGLDQFQRRKTKVDENGNADFEGDVPANGNNALFIKVPDEGGSRFGVNPSRGDFVQFDGGGIDVINFKFVRDIAARPIITLLGERTVTVSLGDLYEDAGATAVDGNGNDISNDIVVVNPVDINTVGEYTITYNVTDVNNNSAIQISRTVIVEDTTVPIITLLGDPTVEINVGETYTDAGATALDGNGNDISNDIVVVNPVDTNAAGTYTITYNVSDANGKEAIEVSRTVLVKEIANGLWTKEGWYKIGAGGSDLFMTINSSGDLEWATELPNNDPSQVWAVVNHRTPASPGFMEIYATIPNVGTFTMSTTDELMEKDADGFPTRNITLTARPGVPKSVEIFDGDLSGLDQFQRRKIRVDADGNPDFEETLPNGNNALFIKVPYQPASRFGVTPLGEGDPVQFDGEGIDLINFKFVKDIEVIRTFGITLLGEPTVEINVGETYIDAGATAVDGDGNDISNDIVVVNPVDTNTPGTYTITYNVSDANGNDATEVTRVVTVKHETFGITLLGESTVEIFVGETYIDAGATAEDGNGNDISNDIIVDNPVDINTAGIYTVSYNVSFNGNDATEVTRTVIVREISGNGLWTKEGWYKIGTGDGSDLFMTINPFTGGLEWAKELPNNDPSQIWAVVNHRTPAFAGYMEITATIPNVGIFTMCTTDPLIEKDADGFPTRNITLTVRPGVPKSVAYEQTETGVDENGNPIYSFTYYGDLTGLDQFQRRKTRVDIDGNADISGSLPANGNNALFIKVPDQPASRFGVIPLSSGDSVQFDGDGIDVINFKFVKDIEVIRPFGITLLGEPSVEINVGETYIDAGATAADGDGNNISNSIVVVNLVDTNTTGTYTVTYNVSDANGNPAEEVTRIVNVVDTTAPIITLEGETTVTIEVGTSYTDAGATANDNYDGDITNTIAITNNVDSSVVGTYTVTYNVSDANRNPAEEITRIINVVDTTAPIITLKGEAIVTLEVGTDYRPLMTIMMEILRII